MSEIDLSKLSAQKLEDLLIKRGDAWLAILNEIIEAGRGHETMSETCAKDDPLSLKYKKALEEDRQVRAEEQYRLTCHGTIKPVKRRYV